MRHNGQRSATPFVRLNSTIPQRLSLHADGGGDPPTISDETKALVGGLTPDQFKAAWPSVYDAIGKASVPKVPEKYDVKLPDGSILPSGVLERAAPAMRELGLTSNENAQRLINLLDGEAKQLATRLATDFSPGGAVFEEQKRKFEAAALAAPDLGNGSTETFSAKVARVTNFTNKYFPDDVRDLINKTGIGSHPNFFRALLKIADLMKEDGWVQGAVGKPRQSAAERIYGKDKEAAK